VARNSHFSFYYSELILYLIKNGGIEKFLKLLGIKEKPCSGDTIYCIFYILNQILPFFHKDYLKEIGITLKSNIFEYLNTISEKEMRNLKKETTDYIFKVLKTVLNFTEGADQRNKLLENINLNLSIKLLKTTFLDKRIQAVKTIMDIIKSMKNDPSKKEFMLKLIDDSQIFNEIYGKNSHIQLIIKSKDLLEVLLIDDKLSEEQIEMIWSATKKGDLEGKLNVLKMLKDITKYLKPKHVKVLLEKIYNYSTEQELINEEIEVKIFLKLNILIVNL
jgi:ubiquitin carboxyl-terminal hydrolase 9/24